MQALLFSLVSGRIFLQFMPQVLQNVLQLVYLFLSRCYLFVLPPNHIVQIPYLSRFILQIALSYL